MGYKAHTIIKDYIHLKLTKFLLRLWNLKKKHQEAVLEGHESVVHTVSITNDSKYIISGGNDNKIIVWDLEEKRQETALEGCVGHIGSITTSYNKKYIAYGSHAVSYTHLTLPTILLV